MDENKETVFNLRIREPLKKTLIIRAKQNDRSLNKEIINRLRKSLIE